MPMSHSTAPSGPLASKTRLEAFSDGVFAIVITLLVFNLSGTDITDARTAEELHATLLGLWPKFLAYGLSFVVISVFWIGHHTYLDFVRGSNEIHLWLNLLFLFFVTLIPFSADLLGEHHPFAVAGVVYGLNLFLASGALALNFGYATLRLLYDGINPTLIGQFRVGLVASVGLYLVGTIAAGFVPEVAFFLFIFIITMQVLIQMKSASMRRLLILDAATAVATENRDSSDRRDMKRGREDSA